MSNSLSHYLEKLKFASYISFVINILQSQKKMFIRDVLTIISSINILALIGAHLIKYLCEENNILLHSVPLKYQKNNILPHWSIS